MWKISKYYIFITQREILYSKFLKDFSWKDIFTRARDTPRTWIQFRVILNKLNCNTEILLYTVGRNARHEQTILLPGKSSRADVHLFRS